jgi:two-component system phosphate regulon response regulator OmpR
MAYELTLTTGEFAMLKVLVRHPRVYRCRGKSWRNLSRGREFEPFDRSLDVQVSRLRKLIEADPAATPHDPDRMGCGLCVCARRCHRIA